MPPVLQTPLPPSLPLIRSYHLKPKMRTIESQKHLACQSTGNKKRTVHRGHRSEEWGPREPFIHNSSLPVRSSQSRHRDHRPSILNKHHRSQSCLENCNDRGEQRAPKTSKVSFTFAKTTTGLYESVEVKRRHIYVSGGTSGWEWLFMSDGFKILRISILLNVHIHIRYDYKQLQN